MKWESSSAELAPHFFRVHLGTEMVLKVKASAVIAGTLSQLHPDLLNFFLCHPRELLNLSREPINLKVKAA